MKTMLITGGDGFIGKKILNAFLDLNYYVYTLSNVGYSQKLENHTHIIHDIEKPLDDIKTDKNIDVICHAAAYIPSDMNDYSLAKKCLMINSIGTLNILKFAERNGVKHFIYLTSANSYKYSNKIVTENSCLDPSTRATYYLSSKVIGEFYVNHFKEMGLIDATIFRLSTVYGKENKDLLNLAIKNILDDIPFEIYNKDYTTDFIYVEDIIDIIVSSVVTPTFGTYNLSSGHSKNLEDVISLICSLTNKEKEKLIYISDKLHDKGFAAISNEKAISTFNYQMTSLVDGIGELIYYHNRTDNSENLLRKEKLL